MGVKVNSYGGGGSGGGIGSVMSMFNAFGGSGSGGQTPGGTPGSPGTDPSGVGGGYGLGGQDMSNQLGTPESPTQSTQSGLFGDDKQMDALGAMQRKMTQVQSGGGQGKQKATGISGMFSSIGSMAGG